MSIYRELRVNPTLTRLLVTQLLARFPFGMISIIVLLHVQNLYGDFTTAGFVLAATSVGMAIASPFTSRLMGVFGARRVLVATSIGCGVLTVVIAVTVLPAPLLIAVAFLAGALTPPVASAMRTLFPKVVPPNLLSGVFSLDATAQELIFVLGPVTAIFLSTQFGTAAGLSVSGIIISLGGLLFSFSGAVKKAQIPRSKKRFGAVFKRPTVVIVTGLGFFFVASFAAVEAGIVAAYKGDHGHGSGESGLILGAMALGSLVGGLLTGTRPVRPWSPLVRITGVFLGTALCLISLDMWWLSAMLFLAGLSTAPTFAALSTIVSSTIKFSETAEAFGWVVTGQLVGAAAGSAIAGLAIDAWGAWGAVAGSAALLAVCVVFAALSIRWIPDLKGLELTQLPETGTVSLPTHPQQ